ncbi:GNAT family N-acetyltransferase [Salmonirosea aquatica]|uniref:GNAT family N-acetyltransferase n=1 Tax=Salmonirosea aquatica TaxID=2654236 RepID=UPI003570BA71
MEINILQPSDGRDFQALLRIFEKVFEWQNVKPPQIGYLEKIMGNPNFKVFVARQESTVIGGLTVHILENYEVGLPSAYVYDLAVATEYQRKGVGKKLMAAVMEYGRQNGFREVFVQAEADDDQAVDFYRSTPVSGELQATHFFYILNPESKPN